MNNLCYVRQCEQFPLRPTQPGFRPTGNLISSNGNTHEIMSNESQISVRITRNRYPTNRIQLRNPGNLTEINNTRSQEETAANKNKLPLWNAQSLPKKSASVCDIIVSNKLDIFSVTETWLASNGNHTSLAEILNSRTDFKVIQAPRENAKGGGVALFFRKVLNTVKNASPKFTSFEHLDFTISYAKFKVRLVIIYRPPPSRKNKLTVSMFFEEFSQLIEHLMEDYIYPLVIAGDFNFHVDDLNHRDALKFTDLLESVNLIQHVKSPTHRQGHTLDLIITRKEEDMIADVQVLADVYSDHRVICCNYKINHSKPPPTKILKTYTNQELGCH